MDKTESKNNMLLQPILAYILFSLQSGTQENVKSAILNQFTDGEITEAKEALWKCCGTYVIGATKN